MFHRWLSASDAPDPEDECYGCGIRTPDFGVGVIADHGPVPLACPAPRPDWPHYMVRTPIAHPSGLPTIECEWCGTRLTPETDPTTFDWECPVHEEAHP